MRPLVHRAVFLLAAVPAALCAGGYSESSVWGVGGSLQTTADSRTSEDPGGGRSLLASVLFESASHDPGHKCMPWKVPSGDQCAYVQDHRKVCGDDKGIIDYLYVLYCILGRWPVLSNAVLLLWIGVLSAILIVVADHFFCPALEVLSDYFKLPANVAGATLLSFGNGAPDVFTMLAAVATMDSSSVPIAIGEPLGGGLFVSNVVLATVVLSSGGAVQVEKEAFLRDTGFYAGAVVLVILVAWDGIISLTETMSLLLYYALFVLYIFLHDRSSSAINIEESHHYQDAVMRATQERNALRALHHSHSDDASLSGVQPLGPAAVRAQAVLGEDASPPPDSPSVCTARRNQGEDFAPAARRPLRGSTREPRVMIHDSGTPSSADSASLISGSYPPSSAASADRSWVSWMRFPIVAMLHLTMPAVGLADNVRYPRVYAVLLPIVSPLFVVLAKGLALRSASPLNGDALLYGLLCSVFSSCVIFSIYPADGRHYGILSGLFTAMTFGMSILWMDIAAGEMVRAWKCLGFVHGLSQEMLGVTVLAWANSFGDIVANAAMARDGFPTMAVAACFASPLFTLVAGLGAAFSIAIAVHGDLHFKVGLPMHVALGFALASILRFVVLVPSLHRWRLSRISAVSMVAFYVVFQIVYLVAVAK